MSDTTNQNQTTCPKCPEKFDTSFAMRKHHNEKHYLRTAGTIPAKPSALEALTPDMLEQAANESSERQREVMAGQTTEGDSERLAKAFHDYYEKLAPEYGYKTREESAIPWGDVPEDNKSLMIAVSSVILSDLEAGVGPFVGRACEKHQYAAPHTIEVLEEVEPAIYAHRPNDCELTTEPEKNGCSCGATFLSGQKAKIKLVLDAAIKRERELMKEED